MSLHNPDQVRAWVAVWPERHTATLRVLWRLSPHLRDAIELAMKGGEP